MCQVKCAKCAINNVYIIQNFFIKVKVKSRPKDIMKFFV